MYYVLSGGQHPFGNDVYRRQNNILNYDYDLSSLSEATQGVFLLFCILNICSNIGNLLVSSVEKNIKLLLN